MTCMETLIVCLILWMRDSGTLGRVLGGGSGGSVGLYELWVLSAVDGLLKDGLGLVELELGLEVLEIVGIAGRIGSTASVGEVELVVKNLITRVAPTKRSADVQTRPRFGPKYSVTVYGLSKVFRHARSPQPAL